MITWDQWLYWAQSELMHSFTPRRDAEIILGTVTKKSRAQILAFGDTHLQNHQIQQLKYLIFRRKKGEPIAYLTGVKEFWSLNLKITSGVFIPRPETECLVEQALTLLPASCINVLDLGTGVGTIALALASERPNWKILGIDYYYHALNLANHNRSLFKLNNTIFMHSNWFKKLQNNKFNLIVSNPPYINKCDKCLLDKNMMHEPKNALISNNAGLADLTIICQHATHYLHSNGWLIIEHGWNQGKYVRSLLHTCKFINIHTKHDYHNYERITYGQWI